MPKENELSLKQRQRLEREAIILETAEAVFIERGYYHTNMDEIAQRVGIAKGTLYLHFARKEELVFALVKPKLSSFLKTIHVIEQLDTSSDEKLKRIIEREIKGAFFQFVMKSYPDMAAVFQGQRGVEIQEVLSEIMQEISTILNQGKSEGTIEPEIPTNLMASMFMNLFDPHVYKTTVGSGVVSRDDFITYVTQMFMKGICV